MQESSLPLPSGVLFSLILAEAKAFVGFTTFAARRKPFPFKTAMS